MEDKARLPPTDDTDYLQATTRMILRYHMLQSCKPQTVGFVTSLHADETLWNALALFILSLVIPFPYTGPAHAMSGSYRLMEYSTL